MRAWLTYAVHVKNENVQRSEMLDREIVLLRSGMMHTSTNKVDTTAQTLERLEAQRDALRKLPFPFSVP